MKLVELLARELRGWPEPDSEYGPIESMSQAGDSQVSHYSGVRQVWGDDSYDWSGSVEIGYVPCSRFKLPELATDHTTAIVTREMWEAERLKLEVKKMLSGGIDQTIITAGKIGRIDGPLKWRDRIHEIDADVKFEQESHNANMARMSQERADLVQKLAGEGFALIGRGEEVVQPDQDMGDPENWKAGDIVESVSDEDEDIARGGKYKLWRDTDYGSIYIVDDGGDKRNRCPEDYKFHSRP